MITCSKCHQQFDFEWRNISKDSTIPCSHCGNECLVKLFDLQNHKMDEESGFSGISKIYDEMKKEEVKESKSLHDHLLIIIIILNLLVGLFILGIYKVEYLEENFPNVARLYNKINVAAKKKIIVSSYIIEQSNGSMAVKLNLVNSLDKVELLSDLQIIIYDVFNNPIAGKHIKTNKIIKSLESLEMKIEIIGNKEDGKKIAIFVNGKVSMEDNID